MKHHRFFQGSIINSNTSRNIIASLILGTYLVLVSFSQLPFLKDILTIFYITFFRKELINAVKNKSFLLYVSIITIMLLIDMISSSIFLNPIIYFYRRITYYIVPFLSYSLGCSPIVLSYTVGLGIYLSYILNQDSFYTTTLSVGIFNSRLTIGLLCWLSFGLLVFTKTLKNDINSKDYIELILGAILSFTMMNLLNAKTALMMWLLTIFILLYKFFLRKKKSIYICILVLCIIVLNLHAQYFYDFLIENIVKSFSPGIYNEIVSFNHTDTSLNQRVIQWFSIIQRFIEQDNEYSILFGVGRDNLISFMVESTRLTSFKHIDNSTQNVILDSIVCYGIFCGSMYIYFVFYVTLRNNHTDNAVLIIPTLLLLFFNSFTFGNSYEPIFWSCIFSSSIVEKKMANKIRGSQRK